MKKKLFGIMLVFAVVLFAGYTAYNSHGDIKLSDVTLANLEALADENDDNSEAGGASHSCYKKWRKAPEAGCSMFKQFFSAGEVIGQFVERVGEIGSKMKYHDCYR